MKRSDYKMDCACGKAALYRVGELGYCAEHRTNAIATIEKFGMPRAKRYKSKTSSIRVRHVDKPTKKDRRVIKQKELKANATEPEKILKDMLKKHPETRGKWVFQPHCAWIFSRLPLPKGKTHCRVGRLPTLHD